MSEKQFEVSESDLLPLESFSLKWRWTDERYNKLPESHISQIEPLDKAKAYELWKVQSQYLKTIDLSDFIADKNNIKAHLVDNETTKNWLKVHIGDKRQYLFVSWSEAIAVRTTSEIFIEYWNDFCYLASDDVSISPENMSWILYFHHDEHLFFEKLREESI